MFTRPFGTSIVISSSIRLPNNPRAIGVDVEIEASSGSNGFDPKPTILNSNS